MNRLKLKEAFIHEWLMKQFPDVGFVHDKSVDGGCSQKRPDWVVDFHLWVLMVELDENQHVRYSCENKRVMQLFQDFGSRPIYVIRFNPDRYVDAGGRSHPSCFNKNNSVNDKEWSFRSVTLHSKLTEMLQKSHLPLEREVNVDCLFYNGFNCEREITTTAQ